MIEGVWLGISGWFTLHGTLYHRAQRPLSKIAPDDWAALLDHAEAIEFFARAEPPPAPPASRIFHISIAVSGRTRELAINDPFETAELATMVRLTRRCLRDRLVLTPETMTAEQFAALETALLARGECGRS